MTSFLERLTDLEALATDAPWYPTPFTPSRSVAPLADVRGYELYSPVHAWKSGTGDAALIAFLRNAVPEVKALIEAAQNLHNWIRADVEVELAPGEARGLLTAEFMKRLATHQDALDALNRLEVKHG